MNNNFKIILVAIISFLLGVMATSFFRTEPSHIIVNRPKADAPKERKPFFIKVKEGGQKVISAFTPAQPSKPGYIALTGPLSSQEELVQLNSRLNKIQDQIFEETQKKFKRIETTTKDPMEMRSLEHTRNSLDYKFQHKEMWQKAFYEDEALNAKIYFLFTYEHCNQKPIKPTFKLIDICYTMYMFVKMDEKWERSSIGSGIIGYQYFNDVAYAHIDLSGMEKYARKTNALMAFIPTPEENMPIQFLTFKNGNMTWNEGREIKWQVSSEKEIRKFFDNVDKETDDE